MNDIKNILLILFRLLGWWPIFSQAHSLDEWRSKTDMKIFLSIIQVLTGTHLGDLFCKDFYSTCGSAFWEWEFGE